MSFKTPPPPPAPSSSTFSSCKQWMSSIDGTKCLLWKILRYGIVSLSPFTSSSNTSTSELTISSSSSSSKYKLAKEYNFMDLSPICLHFLSSSSTDFPYLIIGKKKREITAIHLHTFGEVYSFKIDALNDGDLNEICSITSSQKRRRMYVALNVEDVFGYSIESGDECWRWRCDEKVKYIDVLNDGDEYMIAASSSSIYILRLEDGVVEYRLMWNGEKGLDAVDYKWGMKMSGGVQKLWLVASNRSENANVWCLEMKKKRSKVKVEKGCWWLSYHRPLVRMMWLDVRGGEGGVSLGGLTDVGGIVMWNLKCDDLKKNLVAPPFCELESWKMNDGDDMKRWEVVWLVEGVKNQRCDDGGAAVMGANDVEVWVARHSMNKPNFEKLKISKKCFDISNASTQRLMLPSSLSGEKTDVNKSTKSKTSKKDKTVSEGGGTSTSSSTVAAASPIVSATASYKSKIGVKRNEEISSTKHATPPPNPSPPNPSPSNSSPSTSSPSTPSTSSMSTLLHQSLQTNDTSLLDTVLSQRDPSVIRQTIEDLTPQDTLLLLQCIVNKLNIKSLKVHFLGVWLQELIKRKATWLMTQTNAKHILQLLYNHICGRLHLQQSCSRLQGRVDALLLHVNTKKRRDENAQFAQHSEYKKPMLQYTEH